MATAPYSASTWVAPSPIFNGDSTVTSICNSTAPRISDIEIVRKAQQGDLDAFALLFNTYRTRVYSLCLRMTGNPALAEDLAQDTFLMVFRKLAKFRGDSAFSTWLYRVTSNTVLMHFRKKGLPLLSLEEPAHHGVGSRKRQHGKVDGHLSGSVDRIALTRAMSTLPNGYRNIFVLHEVKGYGHLEIAHRLRCTVGNSKSQLHKAKSRMRELLDAGVLQGRPALSKKPAS